jgi:tetratricopeptide (TPR) repeat protein
VTLGGAHIFFLSTRIQPVMRRCCALVLACLLSIWTFAQAADPALAAGLQLLDEGRTTLKEGALNRARDHFLKLTRENPSNALYFYELARVDYYRSSSVRGSKGNKVAAAILDQAIADAQEALKLDEHSAVAHGLLADLYGNKIGLGVGFMLGARFGPKVDAENKRALELDGNNPQVLASLGRQYLHAPKMFGGDLDKAIASLQKSIEHDAGTDARADETYVWLAIAYRKKGDAAAANKALDEALQRNPRSVFALNTKAGT